MRAIDQLIQNMDAPLAAFYRRMFFPIKDALETYFPRQPEAGFHERICAQPNLFAPDTDEAANALMLPTWQYLDQGGKMLRPVLVGLLLEAYGKRAEDYLPFLAAIEVMEDSSIMMDDFIDNSLKRRAGDCAHIRHGYPLANLSSCSAFALAHYLFYNNEMNLPPALAARVMNAFAWEHVQMTFGQIEELYWTADNVNTVGIAQYLQETIARCAFLSFRGPMRYAGLVGGAPEEDIGRLERLGDYLLIGYHIRGDDLDMSPDSDAWGKIAGEDITTGRRTLLINHVLEHATPEDRALIEAVLNSRTRDEEQKKIVYAKVLQYDGFGYTRELARTYNAKCRALIADLQISESHRDLLRQFADFSCEKRAL